MKKFLALLLTALLIMCASGIGAFAEEPETPPDIEAAAPVFVGGGHVSPASQIPGTMNIGDSITFIIDPSNFENIESFSSEDAASMLAGLSVVVDGSHDTCFSAGPVTPGGGAAAFTLTAEAASSPMTFTVTVTGPGGAQTVFYPFAISILSGDESEDEDDGASSSEPYVGGESESSSEYEPESKTESEPESGMEDEQEGGSGSQSGSGESSVDDPAEAVPVFITAFSAAGSAPQTQNHPDTIYLEDEILFLIPDDNFEWSTGGGEKSYDLTALNSWARLKVVAPGNFSYKFVELSGDLYLKLTAISAGSVIVAPVGLDGSKTLFSVVIIDPNPAPIIFADNEESGDDASAEVFDADETEVGAFAPRAFAAFSAVGPIDQPTADRTPIGVATSGITAGDAITFYGKSSSGSVDGGNIAATLPSDVVGLGEYVVLQVPIKNFAWSAGGAALAVTAADADRIVTALNTNKGWIKIDNYPANTVWGYEDVKFCRIYNSGQYYIGIMFKPKRSIPAGINVYLSDASGTTGKFIFDTPVKVGATVSGIITSGGQWQRNGSSASLPLTTALEFTLPNTNFTPVFSANDNIATDDNIAYLNNPSSYSTGIGSTFYTGSIKVLGPTGTDYSSYFTKAFVKRGAGIGINLTPASTTTKFTLPAGTTVGFAGSAASSRYSFASALNYGSSADIDKSTKAIGIASGSELGGKNTYMTKNGASTSEDIGSLEAVPGDEYLIHFLPEFFEWDNGTPASVALSQIRGKIAFKTTNSSNSSVHETIELVSKNNEAVVRIKFKSPQIINKTISFKSKLYLTVGGSRHTDSEAQLAGTISNGDPVEFYDGDDIDLSEGIVGIAVETIRKAQVYIGEDVYVNVESLRKNAKFYGVAVLNEENAADEEIMEQYPDIVDVYTLYTAGLNGAGNTVQFDSGGNYYVYDQNLQYLGRSNQKLPYSQKYYFAINELNVPLAGTPNDTDPNSDSSFPTGSDAPPFDGGTTGGLPSSNGNFNPGTGRYVR